ncbi:MAG: hypothetical protein KDB27_12960 [Planctomycetales bacterium]|nr:hypothetical protein [Planctomycetales bacterium]
MVAKDDNTPEGVYRRFMIANLSGDEATIRPLIVNNEDGDVLWQGVYPVDVAAALAQQYRGMEISRIESSDADRVVLQSPALPIPLAVVNLEGTWRIDAGPIIDFRKVPTAADSMTSKTRRYPNT